MRLKSAVLAVALCLVLAGCSKLTRDNFDKIDLGMDYKEVIQIIGEPDKCNAVFGAKSCIWGDDNKNIKIKFVGDKVAIPTMKGL